MQARTCVRRHRPAHTAKVSKTYKMQFFCINVEVWNESHIVEESFQTHVFSIQIAVHGTFSKAHRNPNEKH